MKKIILLFLLIGCKVAIGQISDAAITTKINTYSSQSSTYTNEKPKITDIVTQINASKVSVLNFPIPSTLGTSLQQIRVNSGATALEYFTPSAGLTGSGTTNELTYWTSSSVIASLTTSTYPSLTELSYVKGISSAVQTQLNGKQSTITFGTGVLSSLANNIGTAGAPVLFNGAGGTPSTLNLANATGLTVVGGGTGSSSFNAYQPIIAGATSTSALQSVAPGSNGQVLTFNTGSAPTWQTQSGNLPEYGQVFSENFSGTLSNYTKNLSGGVTMNIVSNRLEVDAGTTNSNADRMHYNVWGATNMESFTMTADVIAGTINSTNYGLGFDQVTITTSGVAVNNLFKISLETGNVGRITLNCVLGNSPVLYTKTSDNLLAISAGDVLHVRWKFANNRHFFEVTNTTTGETNSLEYVITLTLSSDMGPTGGYAMAVHGYGGKNYVDNWVWTSNEPVGADFMYVGDSKTKGNGGDHLLNRWSNKIKDRCDVDVIVSASAGASVLGINVSDLLAFAPQKIVIDIGVNDLTGSGNSATVFANLQTVINSLVSNGYVVGTSLFIHLLTPYAPKASDIIAYNNLIKAAYPTAYIDLYTATLSGSAYSTKYSTDAIHPNIEGQNFIANTHISYFNLPRRTNRTASFSQLLYNDLNSYVTIGDIYNKTRTPLNILDIQQNGSVDPSASIHITGATGTSAAAREEGSYFTNIDSFGATFVASNQKYTGANTFTAKGTVGSALKQFNGSFFFLSDAGKTPGTSYTPTQIGRWNPTGLIIGTGAAAGGMLDIQQAALSSAWIPSLKITGGAHTARTASTAFPDVLIDQNQTKQHATGALSAVQANVQINTSTETFVGASGMSHQTGFYIKGAPTAGNNNTAAISSGMFVETKNVQTGTGVVTASYGAYVEAMTGGVNNYGAYFNDRVGIGTATPVTSSLLEISSTTRGFLKPRMTTTQRNAISSPGEGLEVYDLTLHLPYYYNGTSWNTPVTLTGSEALTNKSVNGVTLNSSGSSTLFLNQAGNYSTPAAVIPDIDTYYKEQTDYYSSSYELGFGYVSTGAGAGTLISNYGANSTEHASGVISISTGTTSSGETHQFKGGSGGFSLSTIGVDGMDEYRLKFRVAVSALSDGTDTYSVSIGFGDQISQKDQNYGMYFTYTHGTNSGRWECVTANSGSRTTIDSGVTASTSYQVLEVRFLGSVVGFYIDGNFVGSINTNIPALPNDISIFSNIKKSVGTTSRILYHDYYSLETTRNSPR